MTLFRTSSPRKSRGRFSLTAPEPQTRSGIATYKQLLKVTHLVLDSQPALLSDEGALEDAVKWKLGEWKLAITASGYAASGRLRKAVDAAIYQRTFVQAGQEPWWRKTWRAKQHAEQQRRARFR